MTTKKTTSKTSKTNKTATAGKSKKAPAKTSKAPAPKAKVAAKATAKSHDPNRPAVGTRLTRMFKGKEIVVTVTADGFKYEGETFSSISAVAKHITGYMISGPVFFKLVEPKRPAAEGK
jgi:hypothetical protein